MMWMIFAAPRAGASATPRTKHRLASPAAAAAATETAARAPARGGTAGRAGRARGAACPATVFKAPPRRAGACRGSSQRVPRSRRCGRRNGFPSVVAEVVVEQGWRVEAKWTIAWADGQYRKGCRHRIRALSRSGEKLVRRRTCGCGGSPDLHGPGGRRESGTSDDHASCAAPGEVPSRSRVLLDRHVSSTCGSAAAPTKRSIRLVRSSASMYRTPRMRRCAARRRN